MPSGSDAWIDGSSLRTAAAMSMGFAAGVGKTPRKVPAEPLNETMVSVLFAASSTRATSRRRTTSSPEALIGMAPKASGVCKVDFNVIDDDTYSFLVVPGADRKLEALIAARTSGAVI